MNRSRGAQAAVDRMLSAGLVLACGAIAVAIVALLSAGHGHHIPTGNAPPPAARAAVSPTAPARTLASRAPAPPARSPLICLDPGHGGADLGTVREADGHVPTMYEKALTLRYALDLAARLRRDGFRVVLTRTSDTLVNAANADVNGDGTVGPSGVSTALDDLQARINICNAAHADLLISMHFDGSDETQLRGPEVWYTLDRPFGDESRRFATLLDQALVQQMRAAGYDGPNRGVINDIDDTNVSGRFQHMVITGPAVPGYVTPSAMPGVIGEPLFLSNDADAAFVASDAGHRAILAAYEGAIVAYFGHAPATGPATP